MASTHEITADETHPLRRAVLREGNPDADVHFPQDDDPATFHLAALADDRIVGCGTFTPAATPFRPDQPAWQLRGMAVDAAHQGQGIGALLIAAAVERVRTGGATVLWCNARDSAADFYAKLGFITEGDGFRTAATGLPHHVMVLDL